MAASENDERAGGPQLDPFAAESDGQDGKLEFHLRVPFPSARQAAVALRSLAPDGEPRRGGVRKRFALSGSVLGVRWRSDQARVLRVSVNSFLEHLGLVLETVRAFPADEDGPAADPPPRAACQVNKILRTPVAVRGLS